MANNFGTNSLGPSLILKGREVRDGAGVKLSRLFGSPDCLHDRPFPSKGTSRSLFPCEDAMGIPSHNPPDHLIQSNQATGKDQCIRIS